MFLSPDIKFIDANSNIFIASKNRRDFLFAITLRRIEMFTITINADYFIKIINKKQCIDVG